MKKFNAKVNAGVIASESFRKSIKFAVEVTSREVNAYGRTKYDATFLGTIITFNPNTQAVDVFTVTEHVADINDKSEVNTIVNQRLKGISNNEKYAQNELIMFIDQSEMEYRGSTGYPSEEVRQLREMKLENFFMTKYIEIVSSINEENESIDELELSIRSYNCLNRAGIKTVGQLKKLSLNELAKVRNLGRRSLEEIETVLGVKYDWSLL